MGYRSNVTAIIYPAEPTDPLGHDEYKVYEKEKYEALRFLMGTKFEQIMSKWFGGEAQWDDRNHRLVFEMQDVKWYESYEDVKAFDAMLVEVAELGYCSEIMRVGEEINDIEHRTNGDDVQYLLNVERTITIG